MNSHTIVVFCFSFFLFFVNIRILPLTNGAAFENLVQHFVHVRGIYLGLFSWR